MPDLQKCSSCGGTDIECDPSRGDTVCVNCGTVLEDCGIIAEVEFSENSRGGCNVIGQFVSSESRGVANGFGGCLRLDSRQITLKKAKNGIELLCNHLKLSSTHVNSSLSYYKMALDKNLTRGRRNVLVQAACVYINCRVMGLPHLLIDISDILKICCYELGKAFLYISQGLCLDGGFPPIVDPCLYIMRYAIKLEFGDKINEVVRTATRLVERMKRDSIHWGRRPSGVCGAALLMSARFHDFNRTIEDIVKIVKVHESTIRKRLFEFSDTPTSSLSLEEFTNANLEEGDEQDPPSFKAARKNEKFEELQELLNSGEEELMTLQKEIESQLDLNTRKRKRTTKKKVVDDEARDQSDFIDTSTRDTIQEIMEKEDFVNSDCLSKNATVELGPNIQSMGLACSLYDEDSTPLNTVITYDDTNLNDIDDDELDAYIMNNDEMQEKESLWLELNADYLKQQKLKEEKLAQEMESENQKKKKQKYIRKKKSSGPSTSAAEGIEKMLQGKTFSSKRINYEIFGKLNISAVPTSDTDAQHLKPPLITRTTLSRTTVRSQTKSRYDTRPNISSVIKAKAPSLSPQIQSVPAVSEVSKNSIIEENLKKMNNMDLSEANNKIEEEYENVEDYYEDDEEDCNEDYYNEEEEFGLEEY